MEPKEPPQQQELIIHLEADFSENMLEDIRNVLEEFPGNSTVRMIVPEEEGETMEIELPYAVMVNESVQQKLRGMRLHVAAKTLNQ